MSTFKTLLQDSNLKATHQRIAILEAIYKAGHIDIDKLFKNLRRHFPTLAVGTMYRNINEMREKNILSEVALPGQKVKYELKKNPHIHFVCNACGKIEDKTLDIKETIKSFEEENDVVVQTNDIVLSGLCEACKENIT